jgi:uncharacterized protein (DUF2252 family)
VREVERDRIRKLIPIRQERMAASPFGFFRGAAAVMARDLAARPHTDILAQICGDAHVLNLGAFASPEGHLVFDINDFDETARAPFEWDLLRFATSLVLAGREAGDSDRRCLLGVMDFVGCYRRSIAAFAQMPFIDLLRVDVKRLVSLKEIDRVLRKAERATPAVQAKKLLEPRKPRFRTELPLLRRLSGKEAQSVLASLPEYEQTLSTERKFALSRYRPVDVAFKVSGTGSVGLHDYVVFMTGESAADVLFLQIKEESHSCYAPFVAPDPKHDGQRAVDGQRLMQRTSDPLLGWTSIDGRDYLVRQLSDHKAGIAPEEMAGKSLAQYATVAGTVFARSHARTGDAAAIAAYCGTRRRLDRAIARFAIAYANQTADDHARFVKSLPKRSGQTRTSAR